MNCHLSVPCSDALRSDRLASDILDIAFDFWASGRIAFIYSRSLFLVSGSGIVIFPIEKT